MGAQGMMVEVCCFLFELQIWLSRCLFPALSQAVNLVSPGETLGNKPQSALINRGCSQGVGEGPRKLSARDGELQCILEAVCHGVFYLQGECQASWPEEGAQKQVKILEETQFWLSNLPPCRRTVQSLDDLWVIQTDIRFWEFRASQHLTFA